MDKVNLWLREGPNIKDRGSSGRHPSIWYAASPFLCPPTGDQERIKFVVVVVKKQRSLEPTVVVRGRCRCF